MKKVLLPLAPGFEEVEAVTVIDILRRAGLRVVVAGTEPGPIEGRNGIKVLPDTSMDRVSDMEFDLIVLPGGAKGTENLKKDQRVREAVQKLFEKDGLIGAICAAPTVLSDMGIIEGYRVTGHPTVRDELRAREVVDERVVPDRNIVTSRAPGTAMEFAFKLVEILLGPGKVEEVNRGVLARL